MHFDERLAPTPLKHYPGTYGDNGIMVWEGDSWVHRPHVRSMNPTLAQSLYSRGQMTVEVLGSKPVQ